MLVGDILLSAREAVPDLPGTLIAPAVGEVAVTAVGSANPLPAATYYFQTTYGSLWGETSPSAESSVVVAGGNAIQVDATASPYLNVLAFVNVYTGVASGAEIRQYNLLLTPAVPIGVIDSTTPFSIVTPPQGNSAFLLDSGGPVASASQVFRWLGDALNMIASANGGVPDTCGFPTTIGKALYTLPGDWKDIDAAWYDGYPVFLGSGKQVYRHNPLTSVSGMMSYSQVANQLVCEMFPQPVRTAGTAATTAALSATATSVTLNGFGGFVLSYGLIQFGTDTNTEFASFTASNNSLVSMVRGLGGTDPQAWPSGTPVREMNVMFAGWRAPILYSPGMASRQIRLPSDWVPLIHKYLLSRYRLIEQQEQEATRLEREFMDGMKSATKRKAPIGERQIQPLDQTMVDVFPGLSRTFGGLIVP
jgi:hypothetical protein